MSVGYFHSLAVKTDGTAWAWGINSAGQLGDGTTTNLSTPVRVTDLTNGTAVSAGYYHSMALKSGATPFVSAEIVRALSIGGGLATASSEEAGRLAVTLSGGVGIADAVLIARKVAGLEANP